MITVIICTKDRPQDLAEAVRSVFTQTVLPDALVIIDDGNADKTRKELYCIRNPGVEITRITPRPKSSGIPAARNAGIDRIRRAPPGVVLFLDDDVTLDKQYIETVNKFFDEHPDVDGVTGWINTKYHNESLTMRILRVIAGAVIPSKVPACMFIPRAKGNRSLYPVFRKPGKDSVPAEWLSGCNMAYRSSVFDEGYRFDETMTGYALGEDRALSNRLFLDGKQLRLVYGAQLMHGRRS